MPDELNKDVESARNILATFARHGFRKTSMEDIANAAGVSRQSIYKKFGSKKKCYEWTINTYLSDMYTRIFSVLNENELSPPNTLLKVFDILIGEAVEIVSNPHGTEVLNETLKTTNCSEDDWPLRFKARLADFLERHYSVSGEKSVGMAFALVSAGKGLLLDESSRESFLQDMEIIISSVCY